MSGTVDFADLAYFAENWLRQAWQVKSEENTEEKKKQKKCRKDELWRKLNTNC